MSDTNERSSSTDKPEPTDFTKMSAKYSDWFALRASIQAIPGLGSSLDTMLAGLGTKWQYQRLEDFISVLQQRLTNIESRTALTKVEPSEPLYDFTMRVLEHVVKTRSDAKRRHLAEVIVKQVQSPRSWDEAEAAARLLGELSDLHVEILRHALQVQPVGGAFGQLRVIKLSDRSPFGAGKVESEDLRKAFPDVPITALRLICSELVARGLLHDEGVGRVDVRAMEYFVATELARDFVEWITEASTTPLKK